MSDYLLRQYEEVKTAVAEAAKAAGRKPEDVKLVAVSKTFPAEDIAALYREGQRLFGENRLQELDPKAAALPADIQWQVIGHLQSNKAGRAVELAECIQSVDSVKLLNRLDRLAGEFGKKVKILLELNISGEASKFGADEDAARELAKVAISCQHLTFSGLMTMAPYEAPEPELHHIFGSLRQVRDRLESEFGVSLPELSMGMSGDYRIAIAEGATMVRIGTAIFGRRNYL